MDREEHIQRHKELHASFDELLADFFTHTKKLLKDTTVMELITWAHQQTINPTEQKEEVSGE